MQYRKLASNSDEISILGFGCMRLPQKDGKINEEMAGEMILYAIENGVNYIDTASTYQMGDSEPFLGRLLSHGHRKKVKLATKLPTWSINEREDMEVLLNSQLENLKTDYIDYYLLHGLNSSSWNKMRELDVLSFLSEHRNREILNTGFSFHGDFDLFKEIVDSYNWNFCMIQYNFMDENRQAGKEGLKYAAEKNLGVMVMAPLRGSNLTRNIPPEIQELYQNAGIKRSPAEWALRWVWNHPQVTTVLSGMEELSQVQENISVAEDAQPHSLSTEELDLLGKVKEFYSKLSRTGCTGCGYCMPCPEGVDIPTCFDIYDGQYSYVSLDQAKLYYKLILDVFREENGYASQCKNCGECQKKCPQELPVMNLLEEVRLKIEK